MKGFGTLVNSDCKVCLEYEIEDNILVKLKIIDDMKNEENIKVYHTYVDYDGYVVAKGESMATYLNNELTIHK